MKLSEIGEFGFIKRFADDFTHLIAADATGIGDDCAIIPLNETDSYVITTDLLVEDIHFLKDKITPEELGHKSLAVNLSDIAAMGAIPRFSFLSLGIPTDTSVDYLDKWMNGYRTLSEKYNTPLMGGDTTKSPDKLVINVMVVGQAKTSELKLRSAAKAGDVVCVTNVLGDSAGGLQLILDDKHIDNITAHKLIQKHHLPEPRIHEATWLANHLSVHAMMDISDGIASDLMHILNASNKSASIALDKIPISDTLREIAAIHQWNATELACSGGEDYELLFTMDASDYPHLSEQFKLQFPTQQIKVIGEITEGIPVIHWMQNGVAVSMNKGGFNHFQTK